MKSDTTSLSGHDHVAPLLVLGDIGSRRRKFTMSSTSESICVRRSRQRGKAVRHLICCSIHLGLSYLHRVLLGEAVISQWGAKQVPRGRIGKSQSSIAGYSSFRLSNSLPCIPYRSRWANLGYNVEVRQYVVAGATNVRGTRLAIDRSRRFHLPSLRHGRKDVYFEKALNASLASSMSVATRTAFH